MSHTTFSLLPDCLAAGFPGQLDEVEQVVAHAEQAPSLAAAGDALRRDAVELPGAMRWVERRVRLVHHVLGIVIGWLPEPVARRGSDLDVYPYLPKANVTKTRAASYLCLMSGDAR